VVSARPETVHARTLRLELPPGSPPHVPGQHYVVRVARDDGSWAQRSYSVASAPERSPAGRPDGGRHIELGIERLVGGELSPYLHEVPVGALVEVRGPFGGWFIWRGDTPVLLVGGGSGVVPLMAMHRHWRATGARVPLRMVLSVRTPDDLWYRDELGPETTVVHTRRAPTGSARPPGRLDAATLLPLLIPGATCYVCGSAGFAEHAGQLLVDVGVATGDVRVERFGPS
jgi:ferredoxin-NADP reductase